MRRCDGRRWPSQFSCRPSQRLGTVTAPSNPEACFLLRLDRIPALSPQTEPYLVPVQHSLRPLAAFPHLQSEGWPGSTQAPALSPGLMRYPQEHLDLPETAWMRDKCWWLLLKEESSKDMRPSIDAALTQLFVDLITKYLRSAYYTTGTFHNRLQK